jgi:spore photoproduct lyase
MEIKHQKTKTLITRDNGRSADAISPNFIYGCLGGCMKSYCYVGRFNDNKVYINENTSQILMSISDWVIDKQWPKIPNQTDDTYYTIDIGCSTDVALMTKHYDWQRVFSFFNADPKLKSTFATKYPTKFDVDKYHLKPGKHRIRVSLMPQKYSDILEPNTDKIASRIDCISNLQTIMEVHINFSPIIYEDGWLDEYDKLFKMLAAEGIDLPCECIFLTYNHVQYARNSDDVNNICWKPDIQEIKNSQYADNNIRYKHFIKSEMINQFKELYSKYFDINNIRYIF